MHGHMNVNILQYFVLHLHGNFNINFVLCWKLFRDNSKCVPSRVNANEELVSE